MNDTLSFESIEKEYIDSTSLSHRKKFAQFFTPIEIVNLMVKWVLGAKEIKTCLDPAFGLGIFARILLQKSPNVQIDSFEIDNRIFNIAKHYFRNNDNVKIFLKNYIYSNWKGTYDMILCNPPYLKFHNYENIKLVEEINNRIDINLNSLTNLYALFLIKSIYQLKNYGRAAYIVPSEFMNSNYGKEVKSYLIKNKCLKYVINIDDSLKIFESVLTTVSILLISKDDFDNDIQFLRVRDYVELISLSAKIKDYPLKYENSNSISLSELNPNIKWHCYYNDTEIKKYKNLVRFSKYAIAKRGIATGANDYFMFNISKCREYDIPENCFIPCIYKSNDIVTSVLTEEMFKDLVNKDKKLFLLNVIHYESNKMISKYLKIGIGNNIHSRFLTSRRKTWYSLENREVAPILVSVFSREYLRFIRNETSAVNLTNFHCIYPHSKSSEDIDLLFAYLLTNIAATIISTNKREYANGLNKFEPGDINQSYIFDLSLLNNNERDLILQKYYLYRQSLIRGYNDLKIIEEISRIFIDRMV